MSTMELHYPPLHLAAQGLFTPAALPSNLIGAFWFNKRDGETQESAARRGSFNKAKGAANNAADRRWIGGIATFESNYARFLNGKPLLTNLPDFGAAGGCVFMVTRTMDTTVGATSNDRAQVLGTYGGNTNKGFGVEFAAVSTSIIRAIDYNTAGTIATNSVDTGTVSTDLQKWRLYYAETGRVSGSDKQLNILNLNPGDGTAPAPAPTVLTGGRSVGTQTWAIGGRISDSATIYTPAVHKDLALVLIFNAMPTVEQRNLIQAQCEQFCTKVGITLGSV